MIYVFLAVDLICGAGLLVLIFLHSGKGGGLSSSFGGAGGGAFGGSGAVEKNLDRLTVAFAVLFFVVTIVLGFLI